MREIESERDREGERERNKEIKGDINIERERETERERERERNDMELPVNASETFQEPHRYIYRKVLKKYKITSYVSQILFTVTLTPVSTF